jgi:hypothetical protein
MASTFKLICSVGAFLALGVVSGCAYRPYPPELVRIVDSVADVRSCRHLGPVSPAVVTVPGFATATEYMLSATLALGGTDLLLSKRSVDWTFVQGVAYRCGPEVKHVRPRQVLRTKG